MVPLLVDHDPQRLGHRVAVGRRPALALDRSRLLLEAGVGQVGEDAAYRRLPVGAQGQHLVERRADGPVVAPLQVAQGVERQVERRPRVGVAEVDPVDPGVGGVAEVAQASR